MLITHRTERLTELEEAEMFLKGGGKWVQLRMKDGIDIDIANNISSLCKEYNAIFCIDDDVRLAISCGASAVHLGKNDMPISEARRIIQTAHIDNTFIIGATANTFEDIKHAAQEGASYIGLGPFRFTETKKRLSPILGLHGYEHIMRRCKDEGLSLPVYAIGGITENDIPNLMKTGIAGIAISGTIIRADDPIEETKKLDALIESSLPAK